MPTPSSGLASQMLTQLQDIYYGKEPDHPWLVNQLIINLINSIKLNQVSGYRVKELHPDKDFQARISTFTDLFDDWKTVETAGIE